MNKQKKRDNKAPLYLFSLLGQENSYKLLTYTRRCFLPATPYLLLFIFHFPTLFCSQQLHITLTGSCTFNHTRGKLGKPPTNTPKTWMLAISSVNKHDKVLVKKRERNNTLILDSHCLYFCTSFIACACELYCEGYGCSASGLLNCVHLLHNVQVSYLSTSGSHRITSLVSHVLALQ